MRAIERHAAELGPDKLLVLQYHLGDTHTTPETEEMAVEYGVIYPPTTLFNGGHIILGSTEGSYDKQGIVIEQELAKTPCVAIAATYEFSANITANVTLTNTGTSAISNSTLFTVIYENLGIDEYRYTVREILESQEIPSLEAGATKQLSVASSYTGSTVNVHVLVYLKGSNDEILQAALASS